jgi:putative ABC transport system permease protein
MTLLYAWKLVWRNPSRTATYLFGLALAVGLFAGILFFVDATARQMTFTAIAPVKLDLIAHTTQPDVNIIDMTPTLAAQREVSAAEPVFAADFASARKVGAGQVSPSGRLFAFSPSYFQTFDLLQISEGKFDPSGAMISEAMSISQNLKIGDRLQLVFSGVSQPVVLPVTGILNLDNADALFSTTVEAENAVVSDVVLVDSGWFRKNLQEPLAVAAANPPANLAPGAIIYDPQIHIKIDRALLPADPSLAALRAESLRRQVERQFSGQLKAVDNLSAAFTNARSDVLSAKILFIFLGLPGVALAAYLAKFAAELFADAQRREIGLLRTRGATPAQVSAIIALSSLLLAISGSALGLAFGLFSLLVSAGGQIASALNPFAPGFDWNLFGNSALIAFLAGLFLTFFAAFIPSINSLQNEITQERRAMLRVEADPFWKRAWLDVILLIASIGVLIVMKASGGYKISANEASAIQLSFYIFLAPFFAWIGFTLLTLRLVEGGLQHFAAGIATGFRKIFGEIGEVAGKSVARRARRVSAATSVVALTLSFGISLALFQQTYTSEKRLDAQYIVGSDIRFTPALNTPQTADFESKLMLPGVQGSTGVARDTQALVGSEKNTVYGVDLPSFRKVAYLPDSFFVDGAAQRTIDALTSHRTNYAPGSAKQVLDRLANTPNGVIISVEQAEKYNIFVGDPVLLRLYNRVTKQYSDVKAQTVGLFIYFPTSSQDSDFILNRDFMIQNSGNPAMDYFLIKTNGKPETIQKLSATLAAQFKESMPVRIQNIETVIKTESSSLTSLNLGGLGAMERLYTLLVTSIGLAIFLLAMINERRREFGAMRALGANLRHLRRFLFTEAATIGGLSLIIGVVIGFGLASMLVLLLGVIFTIPAHQLSIPIFNLISLGILVVGGMVVSSLVSARWLAKLKVVEALREL